MHKDLQMYWSIYDFMTDKLNMNFDKKNIIYNGYHRTIYRYNVFKNYRFHVMCERCHSAGTSATEVQIPVIWNT